MLDRSDPGVCGMSLLIGAMTIGFILSLLALGVYISFRIFEFPDITAEGSITLGASVAAVLMVDGWSPTASTLIGSLSGAIAGSVTGLLAMKFQINRLLSGILTMTALYSVNLRIMGKSNIPLMRETTLVTQAENLGHALFGTVPLRMLGWEVSPRDASLLVGAPLVVIAI